MNEFNELDELFREGLNHAEMTPPAGVWEGIASKAASSVSGASQTGWVIAAKWVAGTIAAAGVSWFAYQQLHAPAKTDTRTQSQSAVISSDKDARDESGKPDPVQQNPDGATNRQNAVQFPGSGPQSNLPDGITQPDENISGNSANASTGAQIPRNENPVIIQHPRTEPVTPDGVNSPESGKTSCPHMLQIQAVKVTATEWNLSAVNHAGNVVWDFSDGNGFIHKGENTTYHPAAGKTGDVKITAISILNGNCRDTAFYVLATTPGEPDIWDAFTPNGDGPNEVYLPTFQAAPAYFDMTIYDAYNRTVFHSDNYLSGWNGNINGVPANPGRYRLVLVYRLNETSRPRTVNKFIELIR